MERAMRDMIDFYIGVEWDQFRTYVRSAKVTAQAGDKELAAIYSNLAARYARRALKLMRGFNR